MALGLKSRKVNHLNLSSTPIFNGAIKIIGLLGGNKIRYRGKKSFWQNYRAPSASHFGLSEKQRKDLKTYINSHGVQGVREVSHMIKGLRSICHYSIVRSKESVTTFFGSRRAKQGSCSRNKGPYYITHSTNNEIVYIGPSEKHAPAEYGESYVENNQACVRIERQQGARPKSWWKKCIPLPKKEKITQEFQLSPQGVRRVWYRNKTPQKGADRIWYENNPYQKR